MCGCDCCQNSNPTCFDPQAMEASGTYYGWACKCSCPGCMANVIQGAMAYADVKMMRDKGSPSDGTTTATHAPGCPAIADVRDGCSCLLRGVAAQRESMPPLPESAYPPGAMPLPETRSISAAIKSMAERERQYDALTPVFDEDYRNGYAAGLDAATEAVAALPFDFPLDDDHRGRIHKAAALDVIAALKATP